ncbi:MAG: PIN domain-containing protein [bacterium]|nr:PIN domain-containing protein [bacterium]
MKTFILDANYLLRFLLKDNKNLFNEVQKTLNLAKNGEVKLILPVVIFAEMIYVLDQLYEFTRKEIVEKMWIIINTPYIETEERTVLTQSLLTFLREKIHFADCYLLERTLTSNNGVLTFDKDLQRLYTRTNE